MIIDHTFRHPGLYVEGRFFGSNFPLARSFAFSLATEYMRPIDVWYNAPSEPVPTSKIFRADPDLLAASAA